MRNWILALLTSAALCFAGVQVRGAIIAADTFTTGDGTGVVGGLLNGVQTEVGAKTWVVRDPNDPFGWGVPAGPMTFTSDNDIMQNQAGASCWKSSAYIDFTYTEPILTVGIDAKVRTGTNTFIGVAFNTNNTEDMWVDADLHGMSQTDGTNYNWYVGSNGSVLANGTLAVDISQWHRIELSYEPATGAAALTIGGVQQWSGTVSIPNPTYAGFHMYNQCQVGRVDNFELAETPEPATIFIMALGTGGLLLLRRRR